MNMSEPEEVMIVDAIVLSLTAKCGQCHNTQNIPTIGLEKRALCFFCNAGKA